MSLKEQLRADLTTAMKARDELRVGDAADGADRGHDRGGRRQAGPRAVATTRSLKVLTREAKKRREAAEAFTGAGRAELAARERAEGEVLDGYLPAQLGRRRARRRSSARRSRRPGRAARRRWVRS